MLWLSAGLRFWIILETQNSEWSKRVAKVTLKWERKIKRLNGMTPKDVKVQVQILKYVFTLLLQRKINNKSIRNKKEYIFIYPSYVYLYINSLTSCRQAEIFLSRPFKIHPFHRYKAVRLWVGAPAFFPQSPDSLRCRAPFYFSCYYLSRPQTPTPPAKNYRWREGVLLWLIPWSCWRVWTNGRRVTSPLCAAESHVGRWRVSVDERLTK